jgi:beta-lactamase class D
MSPSSRILTFEQNEKHSLQGKTGKTHAVC